MTLPQTSLLTFDEWTLRIRPVAGGRLLLLLHAPVEGLERRLHAGLRDPRRGARQGVGEALRQRVQIGRCALATEVVRHPRADLQAQRVAEFPLGRVEPAGRRGERFRGGRGRAGWCRSTRTPRRRR